MPRELNDFEQFMMEALDDPPDINVDQPADAGPPDIQADDPMQDTPPDMSTDASTDMGADMPPDIGGDMGGGDDFGFGDDQGDQGGDQGNSDEPDPNDMGLDEKISAVMNMKLYQQYLALLNTIGSQLTAIQDNSDIFHTLSTESLEIITKLKKLDENIRLYIEHSFMNENYSKNLLFFNKCLNLLKLLNDIFDKSVRKGIQDLK